MLPRVLFIQATDPALYPPLIHAAMLMAEAGWDVTFLSAPFAGNQLEVPAHPHIHVKEIHKRPSYVVGKFDYGVYCAAAARLALSLRPDVVYASDPLGTIPGLFAARLARARLVYHEHDSPSPGTLRSWLAKFRARVATNARFVIFPNAERAEIFRRETGFSAGRLRIVWNLPRRIEQPTSTLKPDAPLVLWYHGSITPDRLPLTVIEAIASFGGRVQLQIAGYEAPEKRGYISHMLNLASREKVGPFVLYAGQIPLRQDLLERASAAHVGLAFMPPSSSDINMRHMTGASNKAFEYMASGLALLVSDLPEWREMFVVPGYALACNPTSVDSIASTLSWCIDHPEALRTMAAGARAKVATEWNYDSAFTPIIDSLVENTSASASLSGKIPRK